VIRRIAIPYTILYSFELIRNEEAENFYLKRKSLKLAWNFLPVYSFRMSDSSFIKYAIFFVSRNIIYCMKKPSILLVDLFIAHYEDDIFSHLCCAL